MVFRQQSASFDIDSDDASALLGLTLNRDV